MNFRIIGTGSAAPKFTLTNEMLTEIVDTSDEWITSRTGITSRQICTDEDLSDIAAAASSAAIESAGLSPQDIDLIICATLQGDYVTPSMGCIVQEKIDASCPAFDINGACSGFLYALDVAAGYFARGSVGAAPLKNILVVAADAVSRFADWSDRSTCVLFGDAAGAVVLSSCEKGEGLLSITLTTTGGAGSLNIPGEKGTFPFKDEKVAEAQDVPQVVYMIGQDIYKFAVSSMVRDTQEVMNSAGVTGEDITYVLAHQANMRILDAAKAKLPIHEEKFYTLIKRYGNISAASIPTMLDELNRGNRLRRGDLIAMSAFGAGLTTGAALIRW